MKYVEEAVSLNEKYQAVMKVQAFLKLEYDLSDNEARAVTTAAGLSRQVSEGDRELCVKIMRSGIDRKDMIEKITNECGYTKATATHYVAAIPLCKEWARQELAALGDE